MFTKIFNRNKTKQKRKSLTVSIITKNSEATLSTAIAQARRFADQVVVGVDADSIDNTWGVATQLADTIYRFKHPNQLAPVHMLALNYCKGDWILRLDDDEYMEVGFEKVLPELLNTNLLTHYYLSRKLVVSVDPPEYIHAHPWYPNYVLRLFRNDSSLVWKPPRFHSGYFVAGAYAHESRFSILHFEPVLCSPEQRKEKLKMYRDGGGEEFVEKYYGDKTGERKFFTPLSDLIASKPKQPTIDTTIHMLEVSKLPAWGCKIIEIDLPNTVKKQEQVIVKIKVTNTGNLAWFPQKTGWPIINIGFHLSDTKGNLINPNGGRIEINAHVPPNNTVDVLGYFTAPDESGAYLLTWDMFSENECWFEECGSKPVHTKLTVY